MKTIYLLAVTSLLVIGCDGKKSEHDNKPPIVEFNQKLTAELERMAEIDQIAAYLPEGKYKELSEEEWNAFRDSVFTTHQNRLDQIFEENGFPGYDLVGKEGSLNFWLMVQHSDHNPNFQKKVLEKMKIEVEKGNTDRSNYGLLVDRVNINTGKPQVYFVL